MISDEETVAGDEGVEEAPEALIADEDLAEEEDEDEPETI